MELIKSIVDTLMDAEAIDLIATQTLTMKAGKPKKDGTPGKAGKVIFENGQVIALGGDYLKSQTGNKQAQRRVRKSMNIVVLLAKTIAEATKV